MPILDDKMHQVANVHFSLAASETSAVATQKKTYLRNDYLRKYVFLVYDGSAYTALPAFQHAADRDLILTRP